MIGNREGKPNSMGGLREASNVLHARASALTVFSTCVPSVSPEAPLAVCRTSVAQSPAAHA
eukprot:6091717-Pyramimonas_sp.AAC.1